MVDTNKRCPTGIPGFDELVGGGLPRDRIILLTGTCGTGKTTFAVQFLHNGITKYNEPGILVTLEQSADELRRDMGEYGFELQRHEDEGNLLIIDTSLSKIGLKDFVTELPETPTKSFSLLPGEFDMEKITKLATEAAKKLKARRIIVDSIPALDILVGEEESMRQMLVNMSYELKRNNLTAVIVSEMPEENGISKYQIEEYISDGVIILRANEALDTRTIRIRKMRLTSHSLKPRSIEFTSEGVSIKASVSKQTI